jgi:hypothetical protein
VAHRRPTPPHPTPPKSDPRTNTPLRSYRLLPNEDLHAAIEEWLAERSARLRRAARQAAGVGRRAAAPQVLRSDSAEMGGVGREGQGSEDE